MSDGKCPLLFPSWRGTPSQQTPLCCSGYFGSLLETYAVTTDRGFASFKWEKLALPSGLSASRCSLLSLVTLNICSFKNFCLLLLGSPFLTVVFKLSLPSVPWYLTVFFLLKYLFVFGCAPCLGCEMQESLLCHVASL